MANIFSRPFITLGTPLLDGQPDHPGGQKFSVALAPNDQRWLYLDDGRVIKERAFINIPSGMNGNAIIRADLRDAKDNLRQTWLKVMPERPDDDGNGLLPLDFDGNSYENALFKHCYDPLADSPVSLSNGRDSSISLSPPTVPSMSAQFHFPSETSGFWDTIFGNDTEHNPWRVNERVQLWVATHAGCKLMFTGLVTDPRIEFRETHFWISLHATGWTSRLTQFAHYNSPIIRIPKDNFTVGDALLAVANTAEEQILGTKYNQVWVIDDPTNPTIGGWEWRKEGDPTTRYFRPPSAILRSLAPIGLAPDSPVQPLSYFDLPLWDTPIAFWWAGGEAPWQAIQSLVATQGPPAAYYEDPTGRLVMFNGDPANREINDISIGPGDGELHPIASISISDHIADIANYATISVDLRGFQGTTAQNVRPVLLRKDSIPGIEIPPALLNTYVWADKLISKLEIPDWFPFKLGQGLEPDTPDTPGTPPTPEPPGAVNHGDTRRDSQKPQAHPSYEQPLFPDLELSAGDIELSGTLVIGAAYTNAAGSHGHGSAGQHSHGGSPQGNHSHGSSGSHAHSLPNNLPINATATMNNLTLKIKRRDIEVGKDPTTPDNDVIQRPDPQDPTNPGKMIEAYGSHDHGVIERPSARKIEDELREAQVKPAEMFDWHYAPVALLWDNIMENFHLSGQHGDDRGYDLLPGVSRYFHIQLGQPWVFGGITIGDDGINLQRDFSWKNQSPTGRYSFEASSFVDNAEVEVKFTKLNGVGAEVRVTNRSTTAKPRIPTLAIWGYPLTTFHTSQFWHSPGVRDDLKTKASVRRYGQQTYSYQGLRSIYTDLAQAYADHCVQLYRDGVRTFQVRLYGQQNGDHRNHQSACLDLAPGQLLTSVNVLGDNGPPILASPKYAARAAQPYPVVRSVNHSWQHGHHFIDLTIDELPEQANKGYPWKQLNP